MSNALSKTLQALADPTRREILRLLSEKDLSAGQIAENFDMSLPSVSHHLSTLKNAELVTTERNGQSIVYSLNATVVQEFLQQMMSTFSVGAQKEEPQSARRSTKKKDLSS
jgi:ArsR family transcriptional regulator, arsenate/arsenite/antimonite-responsive transcriptional repressor